MITTYGRHRGRECCFIGLTHANVKAIAEASKKGDVCRVDKRATPGGADIFIIVCDTDAQIEALITKATKMKPLIRLKG